MGDTGSSTSNGATADVLVLGGIVVTMDEHRSVLPDGALAIRGDAITASVRARRSPQLTMAPPLSTQRDAW